jgi:NAD(P)-dependent dehydrogenase (short-subunit alcohol dehydrogenase family)
MSKSVAIVTGASSGIGRATAIRLAGDFAAVVLAARGAAALAEVATEVRAQGAELMAFLVSPAARWMTGTQLRIDGGEVRSI